MNFRSTKFLLAEKPDQERLGLQGIPQYPPQIVLSGAKKSKRSARGRAKSCGDKRVDNLKEASHLEALREHSPSPGRGIPTIISDLPKLLVTALCLTSSFSV